jgi:hypothetical protein
MTPAATLRALLDGAIDYAGLFPPAGLGMADAVGRYAAYLSGADAWALGRFVLPVARLNEFVAVGERSRRKSGAWHLSVVAGANPSADCDSIREFNRAYGATACIDSVEMRVGPPIPKARSEIATAVGALPSTTRLFAELPLGPALRDLVRIVGAENANAKIRTGGVTSDAFPSAREIADFLISCAEERVPFKATAGLHHPCRGRYRLTYDADAPTGAMFGFLNVLMAATLARAGVARNEIVAILESERPDEFCFGDEEVAWRDLRASRADVEESRRFFALSFGSCSFEEPIQDLRALSLL